MIKRFRSKSKGLTLVELLVVVLILGILLAVAIPLYLQSVANSAKGTCRGNMQTLANEVQAHKTKDASRTIPATAAALDTWLASEGLTPVVCPSDTTVPPTTQSSFTYTPAGSDFTIACKWGHGTYTSTTGQITP